MKRPATVVLFLWDVPDRLRDYLRERLGDRSDVDLRFLTAPEDDDLAAAADQADVLVGWRLSRTVLEAAGRMSLFIHPGVGVQHLVDPFRSLHAEGGALLANGHGNTGFTAQHAVALLLALTNKVVPHHNWMAEGAWRTGDADAKSVPLMGRHVGLLGYGAVNRKVHRILAGFDVTFSALRRSWSDDPTRSRFQHATMATPMPSTDLSRYATDELPAFLDAVDTLIVAVPLTRETEGMLGAAELERLGEAGLLVNVARGPVIDEAALYSALEAGLIAGAALDVWYEYRPRPDADGRRFPYGSDHPFHALPNVVLSPHRAASPFDDLARWDEVVENIRRVADGRDDLLNLVDLDRGY